MVLAARPGYIVCMDDERGAWLPGASRHFYWPDAAGVCRAEQLPIWHKNRLKPLPIKRLKL